MSSLEYLSSSTLAKDTKSLELVSNVNVNDLSACWLLLPIDSGFMVQNALTRMKLTTSHGSADDGVLQEGLPGAKSGDPPIPWRVFTFERVDNPRPAFNDLTSDKVCLYLRVLFVLKG